MTRRGRLSAVFLAALAVACACVTANEYGLRVISSMPRYRATVKEDPEKQLIDVRHRVPGVVLDVRYATENNFLRKKLYPAPAVWLRLPAARALGEVQRELAGRGLGLKVFDGYRPYSVTVAMWEPIRNPDYAADPAKGSRHNRGAAVDVSLVTLPEEEEIPMPTAYDDFSPKASHAFADLPAQVLEHRRLLRDVMEKHGFVALESEWWHYDYRGWDRFELLDLSFEQLGEAM